jgi:hypothetical protein
VDLGGTTNVGNATDLDIGQVTAEKGQWIDDTKEITAIEVFQEVDLPAEGGGLEEIREVIVVDEMMDAQENSERDVVLSAKK